MKPAHIELIVAIADAGSLQAAAIQLGKTQPALTKALKQAEEDIGTPIFSRASRGMEPTEIGQKIIDRSRLINSELLKLDEEVQQLQGKQSGNMHVTVSPLAAVRLVPRAVDQLHRRFSNLRVQLAGGHQPAATARLRSGETDFVIGPVPEKTDRAGISIRPILPSPLVMITGENSRFAKATRLKDLMDAEWAMIGPRNRTFGARKDFAAAGLQIPEPVIASDSITSLLTFIENSDRVCSFPSLLLSVIAHRWRIKAIPLEDKITPVQIGLMHRSNRPLTPAEHVFSDLIDLQGQRVLAESNK